MMEKAQGFEVQEYAEKDRRDEIYSVLMEIVHGMEREMPSCGIGVKFHGDMMNLYYHTVETAVAGRMNDVEKQANSSLNSAISYIKKEYRKRRKKDLDPREKKDLRDHNVQKVSLNERYYVTFWRVYSI